MFVCAMPFVHFTYMKECCVQSTLFIARSLALSLCAKLFIPIRKAFANQHSNGESYGRNGVEKERDTAANMVHCLFVCY